MYNEYWGFQAKPFDPAIDDRFYYPAESHQGALLKLRYAIENGRGAALLTGGAGLGKTLVINRLFHMLGEAYQPRLHVVFPKMTAGQLVSYLAYAMTGESASPDRLDQSVQTMQRFLGQNTAEGRHAIVAIDESHLLQAADAFESLRLLLNFASAGHPDVSLLFVGQPATITALNRISGMDDRIAIKCFLRSLTFDETASYLQHRLTAAGAQAPIFTTQAVHRVFEHTLGIPSQINRLCDLALLVGFAEELVEISAEHVDTVAQEVVALADPITV